MHFVNTINQKPKSLTFGGIPSLGAILSVGDTIIPINIF